MQLNLLSEVTQSALLFSRFITSESSAAHILYSPPSPALTPHQVSFHLSNHSFLFFFSFNIFFY